MEQPVRYNPWAREGREGRGEEARVGEVKKGRGVGERTRGRRRWPASDPLIGERERGGGVK